jgi:hypothetical protein
MPSESTQERPPESDDILKYQEVKEIMRLLLELEPPPIE